MNPIVSGILMIVGAIVWAGIDLSVEVPPIQPGILFLIGLFMLVRGLFASRQNEGNYYMPPPGQGMPDPNYPHGYPQQGFGPPGQGQPNAPPGSGQNPFQDR